MNLPPSALGAALLALALPVPRGAVGAPASDSRAAAAQGTEAPSSASASRPPELQQLYGAWRLVDFESRNLDPVRREQVGYLLVADGFLSFECHIGWMDDAGRRRDATFFSGTHTYTYRREGTLDLSQLIGATLTPDGAQTMFEPVGRKREYKVRFAGDKLTLTREVDLQRFTFERLASAATELDFYGRRRSPDDAKKGGDDR